MPPATHDLTIYQGDDFTLSLDFDVDLTGYTVTSQIRHKTSDPTAAVEFTVNVTDAANGLVELSLTDTQTADLLAQSYVWDLQWEDDTGDVRTLLRGKVTVLAEVTR